ncbi:MAG: alanine--tRNA ligase, partial [Chthoniobacterales bacterium]
HDHWEKLFRDAGLDPAIHIVNGNKTDNFWMMGDTGPCGPCSELHIDLTPTGDTKGSLVNAGDSRCIEIWNLVFIQFNANADGTFVPLPQRHVDTGMGFERVTAIIQGTKNLTDFSGTISNYETDVFRPIFDEIEKLSGKKYASTLPKAGSTGENEQEKIDIAFRVIADHIRTLSFAIADGIQPGNTDRNYVLRRILRRAVRYGRVLGFHAPFFYKLVAVLAGTMGDVFSEIRAKRKHIEETLRREEEAFNKTLDTGLTIFESDVGFLSQMASVNGKGKTFSYSTHLDVKGRERGFEVGYARDTTDGGVERVVAGQFAFVLYDTYGFPLDLTELMARERGLTVDVTGFEKLMDEQRARARKAQKKQAITVDDGKLDIAPTKFLGYDFNETEAVVEAVLPGHAPNELNIVLDRTACYAEMGGQVGDRGLLHVPGHDRTEVGQLTISNTQKRGDVFVHVSTLRDGRAPEPGEAVRVSVDAARRKPIQRHHSVTHLLHWALHEIVSREAVQKGSYVGPEKLTFDFSSAALTHEQVRNVEKLVNERIAEDAPVSWTEIPYAEAKKRSDIQQFFGDKYGDVVRVVQIGGVPNELNGYSMELCGGTHVRATGEIKQFKIVREEAIAAGIRRIEAVAGDEVLRWAESEAKRQQEKFEMLSRKKSGLAPLPAHSDVASIEARAAHLKQLEAEVHEWEKQHAKAAEAELQKRAATIANELAVSHASSKACITEVAEADGALLQAVADILKGKIDGPIVLAGLTNGRVDLVASVPKNLTSSIRANDIIQQIAPIVGGKGGGRPDSARGAGKDPSKVAAALERARQIVGG